MLVKRAPSTMTLRKARLRKKEVTRKVRHWMSRRREGGPYKGRGGNKGSVWVGGTEALRFPLSESPLFSFEADEFMGFIWALGEDGCPGSSFSFRMFSLWASSNWTAGSLSPSAVTRTGSCLAGKRAWIARPSVCPGVGTWWDSFSACWTNSMAISGTGSVVVVEGSVRDIVRWRLVCRSHKYSMMVGRIEGNVCSDRNSI